MVNDNHVDNNLKESLVYVYFGSIINNKTIHPNTAGVNAQGNGRVTEPPFDSKFHLHGKCWIKLIIFGYIYKGNNICDLSFAPQHSKSF